MFGVSLIRPMLNTWLVDQETETEKYFFGAVPDTAQALHRLLLFFNNHAVETVHSYKGFDEDGNEGQLPPVLIVLVAGQLFFFCLATGGRII
jgi:hypothetical protein